MSANSASSTCRRSTPETSAPSAADTRVTRTSSVVEAMAFSLARRILQLRVSRRSPEQHAAIVGALDVPGQRDVGAGGVDVAEGALERAGVGQTVGTGQRMQAL